MLAAGQWWMHLGGNVAGWLLDGVARGAEALRERLSVSSQRKAANGKQAGLAAGEGWGLHLEKKGAGRSVDGAARGAEALRERVSVSSKRQAASKQANRVGCWGGVGAAP